MKFLINQLTVLNIIRYYHNFHEEGYKFQVHNHPRWELQIVLNGELEVYTEKTRIVQKANEAIIFKPNILHSGRAVAKDGAEVIVFEFLSEDLELAQNMCLYNISDRAGELLNILVTLTDEFEKENEIKITKLHMCPYICYNLLEAFLILMMDEKNVILFPDDKKLELYQSAVKYMNDNIDKKIKIGDIAKMLAVSETTIKTIFSKYVDGGIIHYFLDLKIEKSKQMLEKNVSIKEICNELGFSTQSYFTRIFKKFCGKTPLEYKQEVSEANVVREFDEYGNIVEYDNDKGV